VQGDPLARLVLAELPDLVAVLLVGGDLVDPAVELLRSARTVPAQRQRAGRGVAEAGVGQPDPGARLDPEREVGARAGGAAVGADPGEHPLHGEAEPLEDRAEQLRLLVAVAAAAAEDDLVLDRLEVDRDPAAQEDVEVLKPNRTQVRAVERRQRCLGRVARAGVADPGQVGLEVQRGDGPVIQGPFGGKIFRHGRRGARLGPRPGRACW
jgi:hypothetical protein